MTKKTIGNRRKKKSTATGKQDMTSAGAHLDEPNGSGEASHGPAGGGRDLNRRAVDGTAGISAAEAMLSSRSQWRNRTSAQRWRQHLELSSEFISFFAWDMGVVKSDRFQTRLNKIEDELSRKARIR